MTTNQKSKKYLEAHPGATVEGYENQKHKMHIRQAKSVTFGKSVGSKKLKTLLYNINDIPRKAERLSRYFSRYGNN